MRGKKPADTHAIREMKAMIFRALNETDDPMTEKQLKEKLGLKKDKVMKAVLRDLSSRRASVEYDTKTEGYYLTDFGKVMARHLEAKDSVCK